MIREHNYYVVENGKERLFSRHLVRKLTMTYPEFIQLATRIGFRSVSISPKQQWVVAQK